MSSMIYPVGPLPPRVYWVRRLVVLGVPLILILIIAVSCAGGGSNKPSANPGGAGPTTTPTDSSTPSNANEACVPGDLSAALETSATDGIYHLGDAPVFTATITNVSLSTCRFTSNPANEVWKVTSGPGQWWSTAPPCASSGAPKTKSLAPQDSQKITITWDGKRLDPGCGHSDPAEIGTYVVHAKLDGVRAHPAVFHFHSE